MDIDKRFLGDTDGLSIMGMVTVVIGTATIWGTVLYVFVRGLIAIFIN